jgi:hypothetical protein
METIGPKAESANLNETQLHQIPLKTMVVLESERAHIWSQHLGGTERPNPAHIILKVHIYDPQGDMQRIGALIDCGATSIFMSPRPHKILGWRDETATMTTL